MRYYRYLYLSEGIEKEERPDHCKSWKKRVSDGYLSDHTVM